MKETIKINLAQRLFDLDSDAYERLKNYLDSLKSYFSKTQENAEDVLHDIEQRIAELLDELLREQKQVITLTDIEGIISQMGTAEDFARESVDEDESEQADTGTQYTTADSSQFNRQHRHLYRDPENRILGGVASGLAAYFNTDPVWIRIAFIVLFFMNLLGLIVYAILWAVVPAARTTAERLQMKGRPVNVENIQKSVKDEFGKVKDNFNRFSQSEGYDKLRNGMLEVFQVFGRIFIVLAKFFLILIGIGFAVAGIALLISLLGGIFAGGFWHAWHLPNLPHIPLRETMAPLLQNVTLFGLAIFFVIMLPVVAILSGLMRVVFNLKKRNGVLAAFAWTLWVLSLVYILVVFLGGGNYLNFGQQYSDETELTEANDQVLYIDLQEQQYDYHDWNQYSIFGKNLVRSRWNDAVFLEPRILLLPSYNQEVNVEVEYRALLPHEGRPVVETYDWVFQDSVLYLARYWEVDEDDLWRVPQLIVRIYIPDGQEVQLATAMRKVPLFFENQALENYNQSLSLEDGVLQLQNK